MAGQLHFSGPVSNLDEEGRLSPTDHGRYEEMRRATCQQSEEVHRHTLSVRIEKRTVLYCNKFLEVTVRKITRGTLKRPAIPPWSVRRLLDYIIPAP